MNLISEHKDVTINTNKYGKEASATVLKFDGITKRYNWSSEVNNTFAYVQKKEGFKIYKLSGNHKFSVAEVIPAEVLKYIQSNE